jgi:ankyrin repeat protein
MLLEANADPTLGDDEGAQPLTFALSGDACSIEIVKLLISRGADVNSERHVFVRIGVGHRVETPCALAAELRNAQFVEAILAAGAEPDDYAFEVAARNANADVMSALLANNSRWPLDDRMLEAAAARVSAKLFEDVIDRQQSPLWSKLCHAAARNPDPLVLKLLIDKGMPVDEETINAAAGNAQADVMILALANAGRSVRLSAQALEAAVRNQNPAVLALLIDAGIDLRMPNSAGQCVLDLAVTANNVTTLALCLTANVDLPHCYARPPASKRCCARWVTIPSVRATACLATLRSSIRARCCTASAFPCGAIARCRSAWRCLSSIWTRSGCT